MKKTASTEEASAFSATFFDETDFSASISPAAGSDVLRIDSSKAEELRLSDKVLTAFKWAFFYLPGAGAIHFTGLGLLIFAYAEGLETELILRPLGILAVGAFMVMFGIGKLNDLKYLKVVAAIFLTSIPAAILFWIVETLGADEYFGFLLLLQWLFAALIGYSVKRNIDTAGEIE